MLFDIDLICMYKYIANIKNNFPNYNNGLLFLSPGKYETHPANYSFRSADAFWGIPFRPICPKPENTFDINCRQQRYFCSIDP